MRATILIPTALRPYAGQQEAVELNGQTVGELLDRLMEEHGQLRRHLFSESGKLRNFVNIYVNDEDIRQLEDVDTPLQGGEVVSIIPSIAGGRG